jgi:hypothetical protein
MAEAKFPLTAGTALAYCAMHEFVFAGTLSIFNPFIGLIALLSERGSRDTRSYFTELVCEEFPDAFRADQIGVHTFEINGGSCCVVSFPAPKVEKEAQFIAIVSDVPFAKMSRSTKEDRPVTILYLSLSLTEDKKYTLGEWKFRWRFRSETLYRDYGIELKPEIASFVEGIEVLMSAGGWKLESGRQMLKGGNLVGARKAFQVILESNRANVRLKYEAFVCFGLVRALEDSEPIMLPGVPFEYEIMRQHFCISCKSSTEVQRLSSRTQYLGPVIVDFWRTTCPGCGRTSEVRFGVPAH